MTPVTILVLLALYPPPSGFGHAAHETVDCVRCHATVAEAVRPGEGPVALEVCAGCHSDGRVWLTPPLTPAALGFGHRTHLARGAGCADCHRAAARPTMADCLSCHDGKRAFSRCDGCHLTRPDGRLRRLLPADHAASGFARGHGRQAAAAPATCNACHAERECNVCHDGRTRPLAAHPGDYIATHAAPARRNDPDCTRCHRLATFCVDCHLRAGITDRAGPLEFAGRAFHPAGWVDYLGGPSDHGTEARRNLRTCVSCHREDSCVRCHSTDATRTLRASPHPTGFRRHCEANRRGCARCHTDSAALDRLCE